MQYTPQNDVIKHPSKNEPPGTSAFVKTFLGPQWPSQRFGFFSKKKFHGKGESSPPFCNSAVGFGNLGGPDAHMETSTSKVALLHVAEISGEEDFFPPPGENSQVRRRVLLGKHFFCLGRGFCGFFCWFLNRIFWNLKDGHDGLWLWLWLWLWWWWWRENQETTNYQKIKQKCPPMKVMDGLESFASIFFGWGGGQRGL